MSIDVMGVFGEVSKVTPVSTKKCTDIFEGKMPNIAGKI
jgi:hypothetical protein